MEEVAVNPFETKDTTPGGAGESGQSANDAGQKRDANEVVYDAFGAEKVAIYNATKEFDERFQKAIRGEIEPLDDDEATAYANYGASRYLGIDYGADAVTQFITPVDAKGQIVGDTNREYSPMEKWNIIKDSYSLWTNLATQGADGLLSWGGSRAGKPLGLNWMAYQNMKKEDPAALVRAIRDSGFYNGRTVMADTLGQSYDYDKGTLDKADEFARNAALEGDFYGSDPSSYAAFAIGRSALDKAGATKVDEATMKADGRERALQMIAKYEEETVNARNLYGAAMNAIVLSQNPKVAEYWNVYKTGRDGEDMRGDAEALADRASRDYANCTTDEERNAVHENYKQALDIIAHDDNRHGFAHRDNMWSRFAGFWMNEYEQGKSTAVGLGRGAWNMSVDAFYALMQKGTDKQSTDAAFARYAKRAAQAAGDGGVYSEGTWLGKLADEGVNIGVMAATMGIGRVSSLGKIGNVLNKGVDKIGGVANKVIREGVVAKMTGVLKKPGNALIRISNKVDPKFHAEYVKTAQTELDAATAELNGILAGDMNEAYMLGEKVAALEGAIAKAEPIVARSLSSSGKAMEWARTIANELPGLYVLEQSSLYQKKCQHAYELGQKMDGKFDAELLDAANVYEIAGATGETACFIHVPKLIKEAALGHTANPKFNSAAKNLLTEFEKLSYEKNATGAMALWDAIGLWQKKMLVNSVKAGQVMGATAVIGDVSENYMREKVTAMGYGMEQKPWFNSDDPFDASQSIFGNYLTTAGRATAGMQAFGTVAGAMPATVGAIRYKNAYLDYRALSNVDHAIVASMINSARKGKDGSSVVMIDGKPTVISNDRGFEDLVNNSEHAQNFVNGMIEGNKELFKETRDKVQGWLDAVLQETSDLKKEMSGELRNRMRADIGEQATRFLENVYADLARNPEQLGRAIEFGAERARAEYNEHVDGERKRIGEYDSEALSGVMQEFLGVKVKSSTVDDNGTVHLFVNPSGDVKDVPGGSKIRDGEIVIKNGKVEILTGGKYAKNWCGEVVDKLIAKVEGFDDAAFDTFRAKVEKMGETERAKLIDEGDPNGLMGEIAKVIDEKGIGTHGSEHIEGRKSIITMNIDEKGGQTRYHVGHEMVHSMLNLMRVNGALTKEMEDKLATFYKAHENWRERGDYSWEDNAVADALNNFIKKGDQIGKEVEERILKTFGEKKIKEMIGNKLKAPIMKLREAIQRMHDSIMREEAVKSGFEKFIENRLSEASKAESERKTADEKRKEQAEHIRAFDKTLGNKVENGERIGAEEIASAGAAASGQTLAIEDKTKALEEVGYVKAPDGSWVCEKSNKAAWHKACIASAREKLRSGTTLTKQEREHLGLVIDETGNTVGVVHVTDTVNDGSHGLKFIDENGNSYSRNDVTIAPFPADASPTFMKAAYDVLAPVKFGVGNMKGLITTREEKLGKAPLAIGRIKRKKEWIEIFNPNNKAPVRICDAVFEQAVNGSENGGARHTNAHIFDLGLTWDAVRNTYKGPLTLQEINDYLEACLTYINPVRIGASNKYERRMAIDPDPSNPALRTNFVVITSKLTPEESARLGGAKERIITIMSTRKGWKIEKMAKIVGGDFEKSQIPEGREKSPPTGDSIPNYLRGFKGAPNQKENNTKIDALLKAQQERGRDSAWLPDDLRIDLTEVPLIKPEAPDTRKFSVGAAMARRLNEEAEKIGAATRVEDAETGKPAILLGYHGNSDFVGTKFKDGKLFMSDSKYVAGIYTHNLHSTEEYSPNSPQANPRHINISKYDALRRFAQQAGIETKDAWTYNELVSAVKNKFTYLSEPYTSDIEFDSFVNTEVRLWEERLNRDNRIGIYNLVARFNNPYVYDAKGKEWIDLPIPEDLRETYLSMGGAATRSKASTDLICNIVRNNSAGYDGVIFTNIKDGGHQATDIVPFYGKNVKMVDDLTYDDAGNIVPVEQRLDWSNPDARFNVGGVRGIERILGEKEAKKVFAEINDVYRNTFNHVAQELRNAHHTQGGVTKPRMWQIEEKMQDGSVKLSMKVSGKTMHIHFTGAGYAIDPNNKGAEGRRLLANPRFEYAGPAAKIEKKDISDIRDGKDVRVGNVLKDKLLVEMYPEVANAKIVMAGEKTPVSADGVLAANVVESLEAEDIAKAKLVRDFAVRQEIKTDRGRSRKATCSAIPKLNTIVVYKDGLKDGNEEKLRKDLMQSIVDMIGDYEGWGDGSQFALKTVGSKATSRRNNTNSSEGKVDGSFYRTFALFGDPKLSIVEPNSLLNKTITKYVKQYVKEGNAADAITETKVREAIAEVLSDAYQQFAGVMESKAWASRMGKSAKELNGKDASLVEIGQSGLIETGKGGQSERASEAVVKYYDDTVAKRIDKVFGKLFKKNDKTFRQLFREAREEYKIQREAEAAAREFNPIKVRSEAAYQAYLAYCKKHDIKPRPEEEVKAWLKYRQQTGVEGTAGRKRVEQRQTQGSRMASLNAKIGGKSGDVGEVVDTIASGANDIGEMMLKEEADLGNESATMTDYGKTFGTRAGADEDVVQSVGPSKGVTSNSTASSAIGAVFAEMGGKARAKVGGKDVWETEKAKAVEEIVAMLKGGKVGPNRAMGEMMKIVAKHSSTENTETIGMRVAEITGDIAKAMKVSKYSVGGRRRTKSVEDYLVEATAAKMVRGRIYGQRDKTEKKIGDWIRDEAKKVNVNEADVEAYAKRIEQAANIIANRAMGEVKNKATLDEIKRVIGKMGAVNGLSRDIAGAFARGSDNGVTGEYSTHRAETLAASLYRQQVRSARGLTLSELNARLGMDVVKSIESIGQDGSAYADGADLAAAIERNFADLMRTRKSEYATMNDEEFVNDRRVRNEYAETVGAWLKETAKRLGYGRVRRDAEVEAASWTKDAPPTFAYLKGVIGNHADRMADYIRRNGSNDSNKMLKSIIGYIDKNTGADKKAKQGEMNVRRKFDPNLQNYWHFAKKAMKMHGEEVNERLDAIRAELDEGISGLARAAMAGAKEIDADGVMQKRHDLMVEYNCLMKYGALCEKSTGEMHDVFDTMISADLAGEAAAFSAGQMAKLAGYKKINTALVKELNAFRDRKGQKFNELKSDKFGTKFLIMNIADLFKRMEAHLHEGSEAYEAVEKFRRDMSLAHINQGNYISGWETEMRRAVKRIYGKNFEKVVEELSVKNPDYDEFSRTGWELNDDKTTAKKSTTGTAYMPTRLSKANLIYIYLARRQADMAKNNELYGCDDIYMEKLENCLSEKDLQLAEWITSAYEKMRGEISPVSERITGLKVMSPCERYCPLDFMQDHISGDTRRYSVNPFPTFLTRRTSHDTARLDEAQDVLRMFENRIQDAGHYIGFGEIIENVAMTFKDSKVQTAYADLIGTKAKNDLYSQLSEAIMGERRDAGNWLNGARNFITATSLFGNVGSAIKQVEGCGGWAVEMGITPWLKGLLVNRVTSAEVRQGMRELDASGIFKVRGGEGISEAMVALSNSIDGVPHGIVSHTYNWYKKHGMDLTKAADQFASKFMAAQYYTMRKKFYMNASGGGYAEDVAGQMALADTDYALQTTQQSGRPEFQHYMQRGGVAGKMLTQFSGPAFVRFGIECEALHRAFVMGDKGAKRKLVSKMAALHLICGPLLAMAGGAANMMFHRDDETTEDVWKKTYRDLVVNMIDGPLTGCFLWGQFLNVGTYGGYDFIALDPWERKRGFRKHFEAPILSKLGRLQETTGKMFEDVSQYINWGDFDSYMLEDVKEDTIKLLDELIPAERNVRQGVKNAKKAME